MAMLMRRYGDQAPRELAVAPSLGRARELLTESLESDLSIGDVAAAVDLSPYHLMRAFRRRFGQPMHAYRLGARVERAKGLIRSSDEPLAAIALDCGFADQSHLSRWFKKIAGMTPGDYRGAYRTNWRSVHSQSALKA